MEHTETLESFFSEKLGEALRDQRVEADARTEYYLVQLLAAYGAQPVDDAPLGVKLLAAREAAPPERRRQLREVGDTSLFVSGFWSDSFARRLVDVDYYIGLGGTAYGELARTGDGWSTRPVRAGVPGAGRELRPLRRGAGRAEPRLHPDPDRPRRAPAVRAVPPQRQPLGRRPPGRPGRDPPRPQRTATVDRGRRDRPGSSPTHGRPRPAAAGPGGAVPGRDPAGRAPVRGRATASARRPWARPAPRRPREQLLISHEGGELAIALYLDDSALENLENNDPHRGLGDHNFADFCLAVEGVSHFIYVALCAAAEPPGDGAGARAAGGGRQVRQLPAARRGVLPAPDRAARPPVREVSPRRRPRPRGARPLRHRQPAGPPLRRRPRTPLPRRRPPAPRC